MTIPPWAFTFALGCFIQDSTEEQLQNLEARLKVRSEQQSEQLDSKLKEMSKQQSKQLDSKLKEMNEQFQEHVSECYKVRL